MSDTIDNTASVIDSRDIIERIDDLEGELQQAYEVGQFMSDFEDWVKDTTNNSRPVYAALGDTEGAAVVAQCEELVKLWHVKDQAEGYGDWDYGETLIQEDYFTAYIKDLIEDCYDLRKVMNDTNEWPYCHMVMDWEGAAEAAKVDYTEIDFAGVTYLMRA